jgi:hypothetical protein
MEHVMSQFIWRRYLTPLSTIALLLTAVLALTAQAPPPPASPRLRYDKNGLLFLPQGFERWVFVGSNIGLQYKDNHRPGPPRFHNIYIDPDAYDFFAKTGDFPDLTVLVMDRYERSDSEPRHIVDGGSFNGKRVGIEVAVKNKAIPGKREDSKDVWAYYDFSGAIATGEPQRRFPDEACSACHAKHAKTDQVWVQFYPVLRHARGEE